MVGALPDFELYGFAFGKSFDEINFDEIYQNLYSRHVLMEDVIFSTFWDISNDIFWIVAGTRYVTEEEIVNLLELILNNDLAEEYLLVDTVFLD